MPHPRPLASKTASWLRARGFAVANVESYFLIPSDGLRPDRHVKRDLWGLFDLEAIDTAQPAPSTTLPGLPSARPRPGVVYVQVTSSSNRAGHREHMRLSPNLPMILRAKNAALLVTWRPNAREPDVERFVLDAAGKPQAEDVTAAMRALPLIPFARLDPAWAERYPEYGGTPEEIMRLPPENP
jgi:hypothetical protein